MAKRVYFAFDYEDVSDFRANVVRNHNFTGGVEKAGYFDASIWEEAKKKDPTTLKRLINAELEYTSATAVLIGSNTWARRWVRYEIMKSIERGKRVIGIHINSIKGRDQMIKTLGRTHSTTWDCSSALTERRQRRRCGMEASGSTTRTSRPLVSRSNRGSQRQLSHWLPLYDWVADSGFNNFNSWIA